jgi:hypothetical protein
LDVDCGKVKLGTFNPNIKIGYKNTKYNIFDQLWISGAYKHNIFSEHISIYTCGIITPGESIK